MTNSGDNLQTSYGQAWTPAEAAWLRGVAAGLAEGECEACEAVVVWRAHAGDPRPAEFCEVCGRETVILKVEREQHGSDE